MLSIVEAFLGFSAQLGFRRIVMDKLIEQSLHALLAREGLEPKAGDLEEFAKIIELYMGNLKTLHSVDLGAEEVAGVFRPEWTAK
jgi:hypothetical protein